MALIVLFTFLSCNKTEPKPPEYVNLNGIILVDEKSSITAGEELDLTFTIDKSESKLATLFIENTFGSTLLTPKFIEKSIQFKIPPTFLQRVGPLHWKLIVNRKVKRTGKINVLANIEKKVSLESYLGPRSIIAGGNDFSMLTIVPTDCFDNPLPSGTEIQIKYQFLDELTEVPKETNNMIGWHNIYSEDQEGRILVTSKCYETTSKELTTIVFPALATNFNITIERSHFFADQNQIMTLKSDVIKDSYNNTISDGTLVTFLIKNNEGKFLKAYGTTMNGIATAKMLHPAKKESWEITAFITGIAKSNSVNIDFEQAVSDFEVTFKNQNRHIAIGPIKSFMNQLIPDGVYVKVIVLDTDGNHLVTKNLTTKDGYCEVKFPKEYLEAGTYIFRIQLAGLEKKFYQTVK